jgi:hypothetical protein
MTKKQRAITERYMDLTAAERKALRNDVIPMILEALVPGRPGFAAHQLQQAEDRIRVIVRAMFWRTL